jgi:hypothetical protein
VQPPQVGAIVQALPVNDGRALRQHQRQMPQLIGYRPGALGVGQTGASG